MAGEYAASKGFPIMSAAEDFRLGPDVINDIVDAIVLRLTSPWTNEVNTFGNISCQGTAYVGSTLTVANGINTGGTMRAGTMLIGSGSAEMDVHATITQLKLRIAALEKA
jgi:hypothetical protein